jgi:hypothetical protein
MKTIDSSDSSASSTRGQDVELVPRPIIGVRTYHPNIGGGNVSGSWLGWRRQRAKSILSRSQPLICETHTGKEQHKSAADLLLGMDHEV